MIFSIESILNRFAALSFMQSEQYEVYYKIKLLQCQPTLPPLLQKLQDKLLHKMSELFLIIFMRSSGHQLWLKTSKPLIQSLNQNIKPGHLIEEECAADAQPDKQMEIHHLLIMRIPYFSSYVHIQRIQYKLSYRDDYQQIYTLFLEKRSPEEQLDHDFSFRKIYHRNRFIFYIIIFENMNCFNNPFYQPFYYIILPTQTSLFPQTSPTQSPAQVSTQINAPPPSDDEGLPKQIIVTREDLLKEGYEQTKRAWTEEQDRLLIFLCSDQNVRFEDVARRIPGRNAKMCYSRFRRLSTQSKTTWTRAENEKLVQLVADLGRDQWKAIALEFPTRNHKQLKDHYENYLRPNLNTGEWTLEQDLLLIALINQHGKNWKLVQKKLPHRSRNQIKNRLFGRILRIHSRKVHSGSRT